VLQSIQLSGVVILSMKVATYNGCKVYNLSNYKQLPLWLSEKKKRSLSKDSEYNQRVELIQDFTVPTACQCLKLTNDLEHIIISGTYPPVVKCYTTSDMSLKFQRGLTADVIAMESLSDNFSKFVCLQSDRNLNFHAPYGTHYLTRIPKFGRDIKYEWNTCDLFIGGACDEIYRLNLELGLFKESFSLGFTGCNKLSLNPCHPLLACGGEGGKCEFWDLRNRSPVSKMNLQNNNLEITALTFDIDGLSLGVGTSNGNCILYDIRSSKPLYTKEHQYGVPVIDINFHNDSGNIISTDKKIMKIWKRSHGQMGQIVTNIEPSSSCDINAVLPIRDQRGSTGLFFIAGEQSQIMSYYVPSIGPAPRWCSFLEGITEELEEKSTAGGDGDTGGGGTVYEDYKFITKIEVEELGASGLIGTPMLRGYMHGFFIEMGLYNKLRAVSKPFEYEEHKKAKIRQKLEEKRQSRINAQKRLPKFNQQLAEKILKNKNDDRGGDTGRMAAGGLVDDRFSALFDREEFEQDHTSSDYKLRNPTQSRKRRNREEEEDEDSENDMNEIFQKVATVGSDDDDEGDDDEGEGEGDDDDDVSIQSDDSIGINQIQYRGGGGGDPTDEVKKKNKKSHGRAEAEAEERAGAGGGGIIGKTKKMLLKKQKKAARKDPEMFEISAGIGSDRALFSHTKSETIQRQVNKVKNSEILSQRLSQELSSSSPSVSSRGKGNSKSHQQASGSGNVKIMKTSEGIVKELSYMPSKEHSKEDRLDGRKKHEEEEFGEGFKGRRGAGGGKGKKRKL
jgi:ribosome biogenesis protein ENP2